MDPNEFHISDEFFVSEEELEEEYVEHEDVPEEELQVDIRAILTHGQIKYFREIFDAADVDKKGKIPTRTIGVILRSLGLNPSKAEVRKHIKEIDPDSKGRKKVIPRVPQNKNELIIINF